MIRFKLNAMKYFIRLQLFCFIFFGANIRAQDVYNERIDSLLDSIKCIVLDDLSKDSITILNRPWRGVGESYELRVVFDSLRSEVIRGFNRPVGLRERTSKWKIRHNLKYLSFMRYTYEHKDFPYGMFDGFRYEFILLRKHGEEYGDALWGIYMFKASPSGLDIQSKSIDFLFGEKAIMDKYNSVCD